MRFVSKVTVSVVVLGVFACSSQVGDPAIDDASEALRKPKHVRDAGGSTGGDAASDAAAAGDGSTAGYDAGTSSADSGTSPPPPSGSGPSIGGCTIFPADNPWNRDISADPIDTAAMTSVMPSMKGGTALHADWGDLTNLYGLPFVVSAGAPPVKMTWSESWGATESDPLPCPSGGGSFCYPIPADAKVEGGSSASGDRHVLVLDTTGAPDNCTLYELWHAFKDTSGSGWTAGNGAIFHLGTNALRPDGWTSGDAAGLPILPGLVRFDEASSGEIKHAIRFTMNNTYQGYIHPATHAAGLSGTQYPPMGLRMRLKATFSTAGWTGPALAIANAMKKYGIILADNGSDWYVTGDTNDGWKPIMSTVVSRMGSIHGSDFEIVKSGTVSTNGL